MQKPFVTLFSSFVGDAQGTCPPLRDASRTCLLLLEMSKGRGSFFRDLYVSLEYLPNRTLMLYFQVMWQMLSLEVFCELDLDRKSDKVDEEFWQALFS